MAWVFEQSLSEGTDRLVLLAIADQARRDGTNAYPSIRSLAEMANVSVRTVQRSIRSLIELGELRVEHNAGGARDLRDDRRPNRYTILMHGATEVSPRTDAERARAARTRPRLDPIDGATAVSPRDGGDGTTAVSPRDGSTGRQECHPVGGHGVTSEAPRGDTRVAHGVSPVSPDPNYDPNKTPEELEVLRPSSSSRAAAARDGERTPRRRDVVWDTLLEVCAVTDPIPRAARGAYNRAVADLRAVDATPDEIRRRAAVFRVRWPNVSLTPTALARRWAECAPDPQHLPGRRVSTAEAALVRLAQEHRP